MCNKILVLGSSSWLGYLLLQELHLKYPHFQLAGTVHQQKVKFDFSIELYVAQNTADYIELLNKFEPTVIVNFLRGEDESGLQLHREIIEWSGQRNSHYIYASSVLALDAYKETPLTENLEAKSSSPYGKFKAQCERDLYGSKIDWTILRFASVQGYVPHKSTRNEIFLNKLFKKQEVVVDRGIIQNRILASHLISGVQDLIKDRVDGIIHFGAEDSSEEYYFLKEQAKLFGFQENLVKSGNPRLVNLVAIPYKIYSLYGQRYRVKEQQTLQGLAEIQQLKNIK